MNYSELEEDTAHSFIVKVWLEETPGESGQAKWRGHITHVLSRKRRHIHTLGDISVFIGHYLKELGVKPDAP